jgi:hypothetical protein
LSFRRRRPTLSPWNSQPSAKAIRPGSSRASFGLDSTLVAVSFSGECASVASIFSRRSSQTEAGRALSIIVRSSHLDRVRPGADNCVMEDAVLHDTTPLAFEIVANNRDGMRVELQTIGEAAGFICDEFIGERASDADWKHAATSLAAASGNSALVQQATEAVHSLLKAAGMLSD